MFNSFRQQPLVHFFLMGCVIFTLFFVFGDEPEEIETPTIVISNADAQWLASQFEATWRRPPDVDELENLIDEFIREEIYVRAALSFGLDQGDAVVRQRLRQKMEFLTEASAEASTPDEQTLRSYFTERAEAFMTPARISFSQILVPFDDTLGAEGVLTQLRNGADSAGLGQRTLLPGQLPLSPQQAVDGAFGRGFFDRVMALEPGQWSGPVLSGYGQHIVRLEDVDAGKIPQFEDVKARVELEWRSQQAATLRRQRYQELEGQYEILRPTAQSVLGQ